MPENPNYFTIQIAPKVGFEILRMIHETGFVALHEKVTLCTNIIIYQYSLFYISHDPRDVTAMEGLLASHI